MVTIEELLGPLEADRLRILASPDKSSLRSLSASYFDFKIPLEPRSGRKTIRAIKVSPVPGVNADKILSTLLWNACFGKKFKVIHWNILFHCFARTMKAEKSSVALLALLSILTAKAEAKNWDTNMPPLRGIFRSYSGEKDGGPLFQEILKDLPFQLPKKRVRIESVLTFDWDSEIHFRKPRDANRIGVGYKDKGSLGDGGLEPYDPEMSFMERSPIFEDLLRQVQVKYQSVFQNNIRK